MPEKVNLFQRPGGKATSSPPRGAGPGESLGHTLNARNLEKIDIDFPPTAKPNLDQWIPRDGIDAKVRQADSLGKSSNSPKASPNVLSTSLPFESRVSSSTDSSASSSLGHLSHALLRDFHSHLFGVLPATEFLEIYFCLINDPSAAARQGSLIERLLTLVHDHLVSASSTGDDDERIAKSIWIGQIAAALPPKNESFDTFAQYLLLCQSLSCGPAGEDAKVLFPWAYACRQALREEVSPLDDEPGEPYPGPKSYADIGGIKRAKLKPASVFLNGCVYLYPRAVESLERILASLPYGTTVNFDTALADGGSSIDPPKNARPLLMATLSYIRESNENGLSVEIHPSLKDFLWLDKALEYLSNKPNYLKSAQLQGNLPPMLPSLIRWSAKQHGIDVTLLHTIKRGNLRNTADQKSLSGQIKDAIRKFKNSDSHPLPFVGLDVCGPEVYLLDSNKLKWLLQRVAEKVGELEHPARLPFVVRIHAGEGFSPGSAVSTANRKLSAANCATVVAAVSALKDIRQAIKRRIIQVRIGHAVFLDTFDQLRQVAELGIALEFNPGSNLSTSVDPQAAMQTYRRVLVSNAFRHAESKRSNDHDPALRILTTVGTDGPGIMMTTFAETVAMAQHAVDVLLERDLGDLLSEDAYSETTVARAVQVGLATSSNVRGPPSRILSSSSDEISGMSEAAANRFKKEIFAYLGEARRLRNVLADNRELGNFSI